MKGSLFSGTDERVLEFVNNHPVQFVIRMVVGAIEISLRVFLVVATVKILDLLQGTDGVAIEVFIKFASWGAVVGLVVGIACIGNVMYLNRSGDTGD